MFEPYNAESLSKAKMNKKYFKYYNVPALVVQSVFR